MSGPLLAAVVSLETFTLARDRKLIFPDEVRIFKHDMTADLPCGRLIVAKEAAGGLTTSTVHVDIHGHLSATFCNGLQLLLAYLQRHSRKVHVC